MVSFAGVPTYGSLVILPTAIVESLTSISPPS
jgi:hypothetical protein